MSSTGGGPFNDANGDRASSPLNSEHYSRAGTGGTLQGPADSAAAVADLKAAAKAIDEREAGSTDR